MFKKRRHWVRFVATAILLLASGDCLVAAGIQADMVIYHGKILTADSSDPKTFRIAQAAAIYDGKFVAIGTDAEILPYTGDMVCCRASCARPIYEGRGP